MTKEEALKLESRCDKIMFGYLGERCEVSMALTGRLKITFASGDGYFTLTKDRSSCDYVSYVGYYDDLVEKIKQAIECVNENADIFDRLIWSYEHQSELEE